jgi:hypothetical protein
MDKLAIYIISYISIIKCKSFHFILNLNYNIINFLNSYKSDYLNNLPPLQETQQLNIENNEDDLDIYLSNEEEEEVDELTSYFEEKRVNKNVSNF